MFYCARSVCEKSAMEEIDYQLINACQEGHLDVVKELIERGADTEAKINSGRTPLYLACEGGHLDVVKELIKR